MSPASSQRRDQIMTELLQKKHVSVRYLAAGMSVSEATVRRDLRVLSEQKGIRLIHGGATLSPQMDYSFHAKSQRAPSAKQIIGELAIALVREGDHLFVDSGTTCFQMAPGLRMFEKLTVIAASVRLAMELNAPGVEVILLGGQFRPARMDTVGPLALSAIEQLRGYTAFFGADGLSADFGPSASDMESAHLHQVVVRNARESVLLVDDTKFCQPSLYRITCWDQIHKVVTNSEPSAEWLGFFDREQIEVIYPSGTGTNAEKSGN
jgi:DeoR family transcriptional regulator, aga operon transcriptional repressor